MVSYLKNAQPNPIENRAPWYKNTAPTYAGIILWFVFWQDIVKAGGGSGLSQGIWLPIAGVVIAALLSHFLFYLVPALLGQKSGHSLAVVGSSVFGEKGGVLMPGLFMGILQFGWVAVNIYFSSLLLSETITFVPNWVIMVVWGVAATFMGLKGIKYVAPVSTYLPIIPFAVLLILLYNTIGDVSNFKPETIVVEGESSVSQFVIIAGIISYVIGFFATAGAAGVDFGTGSRNAKDVQLGGLVGVTLAMIFTGVCAILIIAGAYGNADIAILLKDKSLPMVVTDGNVMGAILGTTMAKTCMFLMAIAAFPAACFSSLIAANSFKNMLPNVNSTLSVSIGGGVAIILAVTGYAGDAGAVFGLIGASFGPICGAMVADYFINKKQWSGPTKGFNIAGWLSWAIGFAVGISPNIAVWVGNKSLEVPIAPVSAFIVGGIVYFVAYKIFKPTVIKL